MELYKFKDYVYTTDDLFFNRPCQVMGVVLYPIKMKYYEEFIKYAQYLIFSKKHLGIDKNKDLDLLNVLILQMAYAKSEEEKKKPNKNRDENTEATVLLEMSRMFSMITHKDIKYRMSFENGYEFVDEDETFIINKDNFNRIRTVVLKMCLLKEPKIFEREIDKKWYDKAVKAKQKNMPQLQLGEMILIVSQDMKFTINQVLDLNIFQFYSYYTRIAQISEHETSVLFATVSSDVKPTPFAKEIFDEFYKDHDNDLNIKGGSFTDYLD